MIFHYYVVKISLNEDNKSNRNEIVNYNEEVELWPVGKPDGKYRTPNTPRSNICPGPATGARQGEGRADPAI